MKLAFQVNIKKIITTIVTFSVFIGLLGANNVVIYAYENKDGMVHLSSTSDLLQTYESASTSSTGISKLVYGKPVTVIGETVDNAGTLWYQITYYIKDGAVKKTAYCQAANILLNASVPVIWTGKPI